MCKIERCIYEEVRCDICDFNDGIKRPMRDDIKGLAKAWDDEVLEVLQLLEKIEEDEYDEFY